MMGFFLDLSNKGTKTSPSSLEEILGVKEDAVPVGMFGVGVSLDYNYVFYTSISTGIKSKIHKLH